VRQSRQTGQIILARYDQLLAIRSFSKNAISISKTPTATLWNQISSPLVTILIHYKRTFVSLCRSLSLMPFECLQHQKNARCSWTDRSLAFSSVSVAFRSTSSLEIRLRWSNTVSLSPVTRFSKVASLRM
jgi:hypothetical protein